MGLKVVRRFSRNRGALVGAIVVFAYLLMAAFGPLLVRYSPTEIDLKNVRQPPSKKHVLGTDQVGRDILSRIIVGVRLTLLASLGTVFAAALCGSILGMVAGYLAGRVENLLMRAMDIILAFPAILLGVVLVAIMGPGLIQAAIAVSIRQIPEFARLAHGSTMSVKELSFVEASRAVGSAGIRIMIRDILPNISSVLLTQAALAIATACLSIAALGFLGLGARPPTPELGSMISAGRGYLNSAPHISVFPGFALLLFVLGANLFGDGLNDYFATKVELGE